MKKDSRTRIHSSRTACPIFQYQNDNNAWIDAPWFVWTFHELRAYLAGKELSMLRRKTRKISECSETYGL